MLPQTSFRRGLFSSTSQGLKHLISSCTVLLAITSIAVGIEVSVATASSGTAPSIEINRAQKGDRLRLVPALHQNPVSGLLEVNSRIPVPDRGLADGCEPVASPLTHSPFGQMAGRCLS